MSFRLTGILALVAAFLGIVIAFWDRDEDTVRERLEQARRAFRFDPARVDRLLIESDDLVLDCRLEGRQWRLVQPIAARADPIAIERLLGALQELPRGDLLLPPRRADADAYAPYGLEAPRAILSLVEGVATNRILIGHRTPLGDGVYVRQSDQAGLARLDPAVLDLLPASADALRDRALLSGAPADVDRLDIRTPTGYLQVSRSEDNGWRLFQPYAARADTAVLSALVEQLLACSVARFVQDGVGDLSPYGLDGQNAVVAVLDTAAGEGSQMLAFGDPLPDDPTLVYARLQSEKSVYAVPAGVRQALLVQPDDLRDRRLPGIDPDDVREIRIEAGEIALELRQDDDGSWQIAAPVRAPGDAETIRALLRSWADVRLSAFEYPPADQAPPAWSRTVRLVPRDSVREPVVLHLAADSTASNACRIAVAGDSGVALAAPPLPLVCALDPLLYRSREILSIPADDVERLRIVSGSRSIQIDRDPATGQWVPAAPWIDGLLAALAPLRAEALLPADRAVDGAEFQPPYLELTLELRGQSGIAAALKIGAELVPGGARIAAVRGRDFAFALPAWTVEALTPPFPEETK